MDIMATGDGWAFMLGGLGGFKYATDKKTGDLSLVLDPKAEYPRDTFMVQTPRGVFIETVVDGAVTQEGGDGDWYDIRLSEKPTILRYKCLPDPDLTPAQLNKARQKVRRTLVDDQPYGAGVPDTLIGLIEWAQKHLDSVPEKSRAKALCRFDTSMSYGETYPHVEVSYEEPETDEEVIYRIKIERERARLSEQAERAHLASLKAKYPNGTNRKSD